MRRGFDMRRIILASGSKARRDLLKQIGLKFTVEVSDAKECMAARGNFKRLVMENARNKALAVGLNHRDALIISADTVVVVGREIIGKPKDIKDAFRILRLLSRRPQSVYSGIAVYDAGKRKLFTDYEKTRISMIPLSDKEIAAYFRRVSPLDKAGAFDIQGLGGIFIDRIEGCYYNVVGLPLAKLFRLLKKAGVRVF